MKQEFNFLTRDTLINSWKIKILITLFTRFSFSFRIPKKCEVCIINYGKGTEASYLIEYLKRGSFCKYTITFGLYLRLKNE